MALQPEALGKTVCHLEEEYEDGIREKLTLYERRQQYHHTTVSSDIGGSRTKNKKESVHTTKSLTPLRIRPECMGPRTTDTTTTTITNGEEGVSDRRFYLKRPWKSPAQGIETQTKKKSSVIVLDSINQSIKKQQNSPEKLSVTSSTSSVSVTTRPSLSSISDTGRRYSKPKQVLRRLSDNTLQCGTTINDRRHSSGIMSSSNNNHNMSSTTKPCSVTVVPSSMGRLTRRSTTIPATHLDPALCCAVGEPDQSCYPHSRRGQMSAAISSKSSSVYGSGIGKKVRSRERYYQEECHLSTVMVGGSLSTFQTPSPKYHSTEYKNNTMRVLGQSKMSYEPLCEIGGGKLHHSHTPDPSTTFKIRTKVSRASSSSVKAKTGSKSASDVFDTLMDRRTRSDGNRSKPVSRIHHTRHHPHRLEHTTSSVSASTILANGSSSSRRDQRYRSQDASAALSRSSSVIVTHKPRRKLVSSPLDSFKVKHIIPPGQPEKTGYYEYNYQTKPDVIHTPPTVHQSGSMSSMKHNYNNNNNEKQIRIETCQDRSNLACTKQSSAEPSVKVPTKSGTESAVTSSADVSIDAAPDPIAPSTNEIDHNNPVKKVEISAQYTQPSRKKKRQPRRPASARRAVESPISSRIPQYVRKNESSLLLSSSSSSSSASSSSSSSLYSSTTSSSLLSSSSKESGFTMDTKMSEIESQDEEHHPSSEEESNINRNQTEPSPKFFTGTVVYHAILNRQLRPASLYAIVDGVNVPIEANHLAQRYPTQTSSFLSPATGQVSWIQQPIYHKHQILYKNAIFLDYDDTILPSGYLKQQGFDNTSTFVPQEVMNVLRRVEDAAIRLIRVCIDLASVDGVFIVTSAEEGWVEGTALIYMPRLVRILRSLRIVSARSHFAKPKTQGYQWKFRAMFWLNMVYFRVKLADPSDEELIRIIQRAIGLDPLCKRICFCNGLNTDANVGAMKRRALCIEENATSSATSSRCQSVSTISSSCSSTSSSSTSYGSTVSSSSCFSGSSSNSSNSSSDGHLAASLGEAYGAHYNILQIGDSSSERWALLAFSELFPTNSCTVKSIHLRDSPTPEIMEMRLNLITESIPRIVDYPGNLDLFTTINYTVRTP